MAPQRACSSAAQSSCSRSIRPTSEPPPPPPSPASAAPAAAAAADPPAVAASLEGDCAAASAATLFEWAAACSALGSGLGSELG